MLETQVPPTKFQDTPEPVLHADQQFLQIVLV